MFYLLYYKAFVYGPVNDTVFVSNKIFALNIGYSFLFVGFVLLFVVFAVKQNVASI